MSPKMYLFPDVAINIENKAQCGDHSSGQGGNMQFAIQGYSIIFTITSDSSSDESKIFFRSIECNRRG